MTDHPSTIRAAMPHSDRIDWDDHASIHLADDGQGLFDGLKALHRGTLAQMVAMVAAMPDDERVRYVIQKAGDRRLEAAEIMALAGRSDFPG
ncbi:MAG: hypothetical protein H5U21_08220 [Porphyrobacter sp.]|nr:hypothetical protein [Porphyrobacter sp.]